MSMPFSVEQTMTGCLVHGAKSSLKKRATFVGEKDIISASRTLVPKIKMSKVYKDCVIDFCNDMIMDGNRYEYG